MHDRSYRLPCCVEAPASYRRKAQYALRMLLLPLRIDPHWVDRSDLASGGLYYGEEPESAPPAVYALRLLPETLDFFAHPTPYEAASVAWIDDDEGRWPVLFGTVVEPDWVASAFFWLAGWQEYTTLARDQHGRFPHAVSLQARLGTTTRPAVDAYRERMAEGLRALGVPVRRRTWGNAPWVLCPTHDVDYLRKWRPGMIYREVIPYFLRNVRGEHFAARARRLGQFLRDWLRPGDVFREAFNRMPQEVAARAGTATYFLKAGAHGPHDVAYDLEDAFLRRRVADLEAAGFEVGLHPSYHAHTHAFYLHDERRRLDTLLQRPAVSVRQHYLRYEAPITPRLHADAGFRIDSTLGFAEHEGFRHATCLPFQVYDLAADAPLDVWEMPLCVMESALFNRRMMAPDAARRATAAILHTCRRFGGAAVMLWHNTLWDELDYPGWGRHFVETLDRAVADGARVASLQGALKDWLDQGML